MKKSTEINIANHGKLTDIGHKFVTCGSGEEWGLADDDESEVYGDLERGGGRTECIKDEWILLNVGILNLERERIDPFLPQSPSHWATEGLQCVLDVKGLHCLLKREVVNRRAEGCAEGRG